MVHDLSTASLHHVIREKKDREDKAAKMLNRIVFLEHEENKKLRKIDQSRRKA